MNSDTIELTLTVLAPPEATDFCNLLAEVICTLKPKEAQKIASYVHFVVMPIEYADGMTVPVPAPLNTAIIFITPPPKPPLKIIAHELAHFLCNHHIRGIGQGEFPAKENDQFEMEAKKRATEIMQNYKKKQKKETL